MLCPEYCVVDVPAYTVHPEDIEQTTFVHGLVLVRGTVGQEDNLVPVQVKRVLREIEVVVVPLRRQFLDRSARLLVLKLADLRFPFLAYHSRISFILVT